MKIKKRINILVSIFVFCGFFVTNVGAYVGPNWASSTESKPIGLYYDGYIQVAPGYLYSAHAEYSNGWIRFFEGSEGTHDTYKMYTDTYNGGGIHSKSYRYWDSLNPWAPSTQFRYGFDFRSTGIS
ncbi:hypothetical protein ERAQ111492_05455 [Erysipelothrix aquatica]|uniref:hypothetical protein n=2 Tax=Erysipelothrix aquatica TaxID=2683714 RepID=UPI001359BBF1|nr:hypothetical protein [Erysipelothrix aquatica]